METFFFGGASNPPKLPILRLAKKLDQPRHMPHPHDGHNHPVLRVHRGLMKCVGEKVVPFVHKYLCNAGELDAHFDEHLLEQVLVLAFLNLFFGDVVGGGGEKVEKELEFLEEGEGVDCSLQCD